MSALGRARLLLRLSWQNVVGHRVKSTVIGLVLAGDALLVLVGLALMGSLDLAMERNATATLAGNLQLYSASAPEALQVFGGQQGIPDSGAIADFAAVDQALTRVANVGRLVPMGSGPSFLGVDNPLARRLTTLREAVARGDDRRSDELTLAIRDQVLELAQEAEVAEASVLSGADDPEQARRDLARAASPAFWADLARQPLPVLDFLDNRLSPLAGDPGFLLFRYLGTDLDAFSRAFERFHVVKGAAIPAGRRGVLVNDLYHEKYLKNPVARELDQLFDEVVRQGRPLSATDFADRVRSIGARRQALLRGLGVLRRAGLARALGRSLPAPSLGLDADLRRLLEITPASLEERYRLFYAEVAPLIDLYDVDVGDSIVLHAVSRAGFPTAAKVEVYGTYAFTGLEGFEAANSFNLVDLMTYRLLGAEPTAAARAEMSAIQAEVQGMGSSSTAFDDSLFDAPAQPLVEHAHGEGLTGFADRTASAGEGRALEDSRYSLDDLRRGPVGHVAVILTDPSRLDETRLELERASDQAHLGLKVVDWRTASGVVAQYFDLVRVQLYAGLGVIFLVALLIINTAIVLAVLGRVKELGTLRALGGSRGLVMATVLAETALLATLAAALGLAFGVVLLGYAHLHGVPAVGPTWKFLFGGDRLYPSVTFPQVAVAFLVSVAVGLAATLYPSLLATRVQPVEALRRGN